MEFSTKTLILYDLYKKHLNKKEFLIKTKFCINLKKIDEMLLLNNDSFEIYDANIYEQIVKYYKHVIIDNNKDCIYFEPVKLILNNIFLKTSLFKHLKFKNIKYLEIHEKPYISNYKLKNYYFLPNKIVYYKNDYDTLKYLPNSVKILDCYKKHKNSIKNIPNKIKVIIIIRNMSFYTKKNKSFTKYYKISNIKIDITNTLDDIYQLKN